MKHPTISASGLRKSSLVRIISLYSVATIALVVVGVLVLGYLGKTWTETISFKVDDGWCKTGFEGIGRHCFGDFGLAYNRGYQESVYLPQNYAATNTPVTALIFELLRLLPYDLALILYLSGAVIALAYPIFAETRGFPVEVRSLIILAISICGAGSISAIDRGNHVAYLVPLLYLYLIAIEQKKWNRATLLLVGLASLKFWGIIFIISLLLNRRIWESIKAVCLTTVISLTALITFPGSLDGKLRIMFAMVSSKDYSNSIAGYALSFFGLARRTGCLLSTQTWCNTKSYVGTFWTSTAALSLITAGALFVLVVLHCVGFKHRIIATLLTSTIGIVLVPDAPRYNSVFVIVLVSLVFYFHRNHADVEPAWTFRDIVPWVLGITVAVTLMPLTLGTNSLTRFSTGTGEGPLIARLDFWLVPLLFVIAFLSSGVSAGLSWLRRHDQDR